MRLHEEFKLYETMWEETQVSEAVSSTYRATYDRLAKKFAEAEKEANINWAINIIDYGVDCGYYDDHVAAQLQDAATKNINTGVPNMGLEDLYYTGDKAIDDLFIAYAESEAENFDTAFDFYNMNFICYLDGTYEYFDSYEDTFTGDVNQIECVIGIDYASGASIGWIRGEDDIEDLNNLLNI